MQNLYKFPIRFAAAMLLILCLCVNQRGIAQEIGLGNESVFELTWSNDIVNQTDRYFSNGLDLTLYHVFMQKSPGRYLLLPDKWAFSVYHGITMKHHFFTPDRLINNDINRSDRPFSSYLLIGHEKVALSPQKKVKLTSKIEIGLLGKYSGGETVQNGIHALLPASEITLGWGNQINPDPALNYSVKYEKGLVSNDIFELIPHAGARLGIPYTDIDAGVFLRLGNFPGYFNNLGWMDQKGINYYFFADVTARYVLYNATLQGGLINESPYTLERINPLISEIRAGVAFGIRKVTFEYAQHFLSPEFDGGLDHKWGTFTFRIVF